jgi:hypothetical protein
MYHGEDVGTVDIRNLVTVADGTVEHHSKRFELDPNDPESERWSLVVFYHNKWHEADFHYQMQMLKFNPDLREDVIIKTGSYDPEAAHDRVIVEFCCDENSELGRPRIETHGCQVVRLTEEVDMRTNDGLFQAIKLIRKIPSSKMIMLWSSTTCTGGCPLQSKNRARYKRTKDYAGLRRLESYKEDFQQLMMSLNILADLVIQRNGIVVVEWPRQCAWWKEALTKRLENPEIVKINAKSRTWQENPKWEKEKRDSRVQATVEFDGCAYGTRNQKGEAVKKPWMIKAIGKRTIGDDVRKFAMSLERKCKCQADENGRNTVKTVERT